MGWHRRGGTGQHARSASRANLQHDAPKPCHRQGCTLPAAIRIWITPVRWQLCKDGCHLPGGIHLLLAAHEVRPCQ